MNSHALGNSESREFGHSLGQVIEGVVCEMSQPTVNFPAATKQGVVYLSVSWSSLPRLLLDRMRRRESWYWHSRMTSSLGQQLLRRLRTSPVDVLSVPTLDLGSDSMAGPMLRALATLDELEIEPLLARYARRYPTATNATGILRSILVHRIAGRALDAFHVDLWASTIGLDQVTFVGCSEWDKILLSDHRRRRKVVGSVVRTVDHIGGLVTRLTRWRPTRKKHNSNAPKRVHDEQFDVDVAHEGKDSDALRKVLYILNFGVSYGGLYLYDHVFSDDPASPLYRQNVAVMGRLGGPSNLQGIRHGFPERGSRARQLRRTLRYSIQALWEFKRQYPFRYVWTLSRICAAVEGERVAISRDFPALKLAILAYDMQAPGDLILALDSSGVRTVALNERPQSVIWEVQPFALSTLLTAGEIFSASAMASRSVSIEQAISVGMWRTDFLHQYRSKVPHEHHEQAQRNGQQFIVALPFHVTAEGEQDGSPLITSALSVRHFLLDMCRIAEEMPSVFIVIRGKNDNWVTDDRFQDIVGMIDQLPNITVSRDYATFNESYRLCAWADLVVAKHTSLVDEVLSVGIPCVVHDYTPNSKDLVRLLVPYLPRDIWAEDVTELRRRIEFALEDEGREFHRWWEPHRMRIYGELNDGSVRLRARACMSSLVGVGQ